MTPAAPPLVIRTREHIVVRGFRARRPLAGAVLAASLIGAPRPSAADPTPSLALEPAPAGDRGFAVERASVRGHLAVSARIVTDYAHAPLVLRNDAQEADPVVAYQAWAHALAAFAIGHRFVVNVDVPFVMSQAGGAEPLSGSTAPRPRRGAAFGDIRLGARLKLVGSAEDADVRTDLALASAVWFPSATEGYTGDGVARMRVGLILEGQSRRLYWGFNGGLRTRPTEQLPGALPTRLGTSLSFGLAGGFFADARREIAIGTELVADLPVGGGARLFDPRATVAHMLVSGHYRVLGGPFELGAAFGPGIGQGPGSADYRVLALVGFAPERAAPPPDKDRDGIPDKSDACGNLPGVSSRDPLLNGCPPPPADGDGDGIPDRNDACVTVPGEATGVRATHGCPKPVDTDGDGVSDAVDACPREAGVPPPAGNGCPEPPRAKLVEQAIEISQQVQFETGTAVLRPESDAVLGEVARVLGENPEIELIEVQGHTDDKGRPELNRRLGQERADSVVTWLAGHGVGRARLSAKGYGPDRPLSDNTTEEGRAKNRRVEFRILRTAPSAPPRTPGEGGRK